MTQQELGLNLSTRRTRKAVFLDEMNLVVPWTELLSLIAPHAPRAKTGRPPFELVTMLRIHFLQQWFGLSDLAMEEALFETTLYREFAGLSSVERIPDRVSILRFRHLLEEHQLAPQILADETATSACAFVLAALRYYRSLGVEVEQIMTDNGSAYTSRRFARLLRRLGIRHVRTRPYTPRTNGKAERFIQTLLREWAYAFVYPNSAHRTEELQPWMYHYNFHRPHSAVAHKPPITRLGFEGNNVVRNYT